TLLPSNVAFTAGRISIFNDVFAPFTITSFLGVTVTVTLSSKMTGDLPIRDISHLPNSAKKFATKIFLSSLFLTHDSLARAQDAHPKTRSNFRNLSCFYI